MGSPHHRENILNGDYNLVGIGVVYGSGGAIYVTVDFMDLPGASVSAPAPSAPRTATRAPSAPRATAPAAPRVAAPVTSPPPPTTSVPPPPLVPVAAAPSANPTPAFVQVLSELRELDQ